MKDYIDLINNSEEWLMNRVLEYAEKFEFTKYTSTLAEAWRLSVSGLSDSLILAAKHYSDTIPELHPDDKYVSDPISKFGIIEAQKHRQRGTTLGMFLGLMKYYNESYNDLIEIYVADEIRKNYYKKFTQRCFDRIEIAYCIEWTSHGDDSLIKELQDSNRKMTNEKNKYLTIFESSYVPIILLDEHLKISNLNQAAIELFTNLKISGSIYYNDSNSDSSFKLLNEQILQFINSNPSETFFETHLTTNKGDLLFQVKLSKMQDVSKKFSGTVIMLDDITERKQNERKLKENEEYFVSIFENNSAAISLIEPDTTISMVNTEYCKISGYTKDEVIGMSWTQQITPTDLERIMDFDRRNKIDPNDVPHKYEFSFYKKNGEIRHALMFTSTLSNNKKIASFIDISELKQTEKALKESEEKLNKLNADKDRFISILGHDLRSPFSNLLGLSEDLEENINRYKLDEIKNMVGYINKTAQSTFNLLEDILLWGRTQQGSIPFKPQNLSFTNICSNVLESLDAQATAKNISINISATDQLTIIADNDMLKIVLRNLVSNAIKFTNKGGKINISAEKTSSVAIISVSDNGIGIKPENLVKLFDIGQVMTTKGTADEKGTGLGLTLCKEFVEKHNGKIWVESEYGKGSEIKFTLPLPIEHTIA